MFSIINCTSTVQILNYSSIKQQAVHKEIALSNISMVETTKLDLHLSVIMVVTKRNQRMSYGTTKFDPHFVVVVEVANYLEVESCKQLNLIHILLSLNAILLPFQVKPVDLKVI